MSVLLSFSIEYATFLHASFEAFTAVTFHVHFFWVVVPYSVL